MTSNQRRELYQYSQTQAIYLGIENQFLLIYTACSTLYVENVSFHGSQKVTTEEFNNTITNYQWRTEGVRGVRTPHWHAKTFFYIFKWHLLLVL